MDDEFRAARSLLIHWHQFSNFAAKWTLGSADTELSPEEKDAPKACYVRARDCHCTYAHCYQRIYDIPCVSADTIVPVTDSNFFPQIVCLSPLSYLQEPTISSHLSYPPRKFLVRAWACFGSSADVMEVIANLCSVFALHLAKTIKMFRKYTSTRT